VPRRRDGQHAVGTGSTTFAVQAGKNFAVNQWVLAQSSGAPTAQMYGQIASYSGTSLVVNVTAIGGSGTHADWTIVLSNSATAAGYQSPVGTGNVRGPGSSTSNNLPKLADATGKRLADSGVAAGTLVGRMRCFTAMPGRLRSRNARHWVRMSCVGIFVFRALSSRCTRHARVNSAAAEVARQASAVPCPRRPARGRAAVSMA
jgi:hypothetical protein